MSTSIDLFEHYGALPKEVQDLILTITDEFDYKDCENMVLSLNDLGYTCEYGLSAELFNLQKLETTNKTPEEMNTTENIVFEKGKKQIIKKGNHFFTRITENGESFESGDFNTLLRAKESLGIVPTTEEKNILIVEFLQVDKNENGTFELPQHCKMTLGGTFKTEFQSNQLKFHSDWNWLIPTIEKCRESQIFGSQRLIDNIDKRLLKLDLLATYENVVDFIQWHNQQKK